MENENFLHKIIGALRRYWLVAAAVFAAAVCAGIAFSFLRTAFYTATVTAVYSARDIAVEDQNSTSHINVANGYLDTFADFIDEENVLSRADYYYSLFADRHADGCSIDDFTDELRAAADKEYAYSELGELIGKPVYVFVKHTEYNEFGSSAKKTDYVYSGELISFTADAITLEKDGITFTVDRIVTEEGSEAASKTEFSHAKAVSSYKSEYDYGDLEYAVGMRIKAVVNSNGVRSVKTGVLQSFDSTGIVLKSGDNESGVPKADFVTAYPDYPESIVKEGIKVNYTSNDKSFGMTVSYKDADPQDSLVKAKLTVLAAALEANVIEEPESGQRAEFSYKYFPRADISFTDMGTASPAIDMSKTKIVIIFALIGLILSAVSVYLASVSDRTIKSKNQLEEITGVSMLAAIEKTEGF